MVNVDRATPMLLPPDLREGVAADDMVHFVIESVDGMALSTLQVNRRGTGSAQYPPKMMLALQETLRTDEGRRKYAQRKQTVEPVFGILKHVLGFRPFL